MNKLSKIYVAGHGGLVGSAIVRYLKKEGYINILTRTHKDCDLTDFESTNLLFQHEKPDYIFLAAALVGGILANDSKPADFLHTNLMIQNNVIKSALEHKVKKLLFLGSSCIYPRNCPQPIKEEYLMTASLEKTNEAYAIAKIAGIKYCQACNKQYGTNFISCMPTNLYGPNDSYDLNNSHVIPALIRKIHEAKVNKEKEVVLWGDGSPMREFLYVDDLAEACVHLMNNYDNSEIINVGTGKDVSIRQLADSIKQVVGYTGKIVWDKKMPNGTPRKVLDVSKIARLLNWYPKTFLMEGLSYTYKDFLYSNKIRS